MQNCRRPTCMYSRMSLELIGTQKTLTTTTEGALIRSLASMRPQMGLQVTRLRVFFLASLEVTYMSPWLQRLHRLSSKKHYIFLK